MPSSGEGVTDLPLRKPRSRAESRSRSRMRPGKSDSSATARDGRVRRIEKPSLTERVREEILRRILDGEIAPGERIIEMRVAQELGTSQAPVREALRALEVLGVIESSRNRGARVRMLEARELAEITDVRAELEGYAAGLASTRLKGDTAGLEVHIMTMRRAAKAKDMRRFAGANARFHRAIMEATGNATLLDIWTQLDVKAHTIMNVLRGHRDLTSVAESHWPIVAALKSGDARAARTAIRRHILGLKLHVP
jgi:DNA-binding GntR family transcriptional regulator